MIIVHCDNMLDKCSFIFLETLFVPVEESTDALDERNPMYRIT